MRTCIGSERRTGEIEERDWCQGQTDRESVGLSSTLSVSGGGRTLSTRHVSARQSPLIWSANAPSGRYKVRLYAESETEFFMQGGQGVPARLTFQRDGTGVVTGLVLPQGGEHKPGRSSAIGVATKWIDAYPMPDENQVRSDIH